MKIRALLLASIVAVPAYGADTLEIDPEHSAVLFSWNHIGISNPVARLEKIQGTVILDQVDPAKSSVTVTMPLDGLRTGSEALDKVIKRDTFLDAERFPEITFKSTGLKMTGPKTFKLSGELTAHGITKPVILDAKVNGIAPNGFSGVLQAGFDADVVVRRSDFDAARFAPAVTDELKVHITVETHGPEKDES